jgi:ABC-2 type transport system permease protein
LISTLKHYFIVQYYFARMAILRQLEYPIFLVSWLLVLPFQYFTGVWMIKLILDKFTILSDWTFNELAFIYGLSLISHALLVIFFIQSWNMSGMVIQGGFDRLLLRPLNVFFQFSSSNINFIGFIDLIPAILIFSYASITIGFEWSLINISKLFLTILGATLIQCAIFTIIGCIAFWTKKSDSLTWLTLEIIDRTTMYPMVIFPTAIKILLTIIPIGFISYYPALDLIDKQTEFVPFIPYSILTCIIGILLFGICILFFNYGLKRYESSGS